MTRINRVHSLQEDVELGMILIILLYILLDPLSCGSRTRYALHTLNGFTFHNTVVPYKKCTTKCTTISKNVNTDSTLTLQFVTEMECARYSCSAPIVQRYTQIRNKIKNILFNVSVTSKPELNWVLTSTSCTTWNPSKSLRTTMPSTCNWPDCMGATCLFKKKKNVQPHH